MNGLCMKTDLRDRPTSDIKPDTVLVKLTNTIYLLMSAGVGNLPIVTAYPTEGKPRNPYGKLLARTVMLMELRPFDITAWCDGLL